MASIAVKVIASALGLAFVLAAAAPAEAAKARKHKAKAVMQVRAVAPGGSGYRGTGVFPAGPIYNGPKYLGDDPDPSIRFQIWRDQGMHYGGDG